MLWVLMALKGIWEQYWRLGDTVGHYGSFGGTMGAGRHYRRLGGSVAGSRS